MNAGEELRPWWVPSSARVASGWWLLVALPVLWAEYLTGIYTEFPLVYVVLVSLSAWYSGWRPALALTVGIPLAHFAFNVLDSRQLDLLALLGTEALRGVVIGVLALWLSRLSDHERALQDELRNLRGRLLPICSFCKSIKNDMGEWERLERFISKRSQTQFSHGVCPACRDVHYFGLGAND